MHFIKDLEAFLPLNAQEENDKRLMLASALEKGDFLLKRESGLMHMTASSMIVNTNRTKVLMAYHNIYKSWAWTGGHADGESDLLCVALKEAREETGIKTLMPISPNPVSLEILHVPPHIKRGAYVGVHLHFNLTYALIGDETEEIFIKPDENAKVGWLPIDRLGEYVSEKSMLPVYEKILSRMR